MAPGSIRSAGPGGAGSREPSLPRGTGPLRSWPGPQLSPPAPPEQNQRAGLRGFGGLALLPGGGGPPPGYFQAPDRWLFSYLGLLTTPSPSPAGTCVPGLTRAPSQYWLSTSGNVSLPSFLSHARLTVPPSLEDGALAPGRGAAVCHDSSECLRTGRGGLGRQEPPGRMARCWQAPAFHLPWASSRSQPARLTGPSWQRRA